MGARNFLISGVSGAGKTSVGEELQRRGHHVVHGDRELSYQGDPTTGAPVEGVTGTDVHHHHLWRVERVKALVSSRTDAATFFCGGARNTDAFIDLFDGVFVLEVDADTLSRRLAQRGNDEWAGRDRDDERELVLALHQSGADVPQLGIIIDATQRVDRVVDRILSLARVENPTRQ